MRSGSVFGTSMLALLLGTAVFAQAERNGKDWDHGKEHANGPEQRHESHGNQREAVRRGPEQRHENHGNPHEARRGPDHDFHGEHGNPHYREVTRPTPRYGHQDIWARQRAHDWRHEHRDWHARGGYRGYRIPEARFHERFGRGHWFRVHDVPVLVVEGAPRFQFGGLWFSVVDPCPETWSPVWYRTDEVYIDYVHDGYYMFNRRHPGVAIAVNVSL